MLDHKKVPLEAADCQRVSRSRQRSHEPASEQALHRAVPRCSLHHDGLTMKEKKKKERQTGNERMDERKRGTVKPYPQWAKRPSPRPAGCPSRSPPVGHNGHSVTGHNRKISNSMCPGSIYMAGSAAWPARPRHDGSAMSKQVSQAPSIPAVRARHQHPNDAATM